MPYTPPTQQSPIASRPESPSITRSQSYIKSQPKVDSASGPVSRPDLPRSASSTSYLHKHRRSPSTSKTTAFAPGPSTPDGKPLTKDAELANETEDRSKLAPNTSLHRSPPPVNYSLIPSGALMSPPDSSQNSSDDEQSSRRKRGRELENLAELQAAIRIIEQHRESSPNRTNEETRKARIALGLVAVSKESSKEDSRPIATSPRAQLSMEARRISHSRSSTESSALFDLGGVKGESPVRVSDDSDPEEAEDDELRTRPPMVRKKSGELVRPALRPSFSKRRPSSMPGTPTYSKAVHFDSQLEHVRHFLQVDKPLAVSAGSSPVEAYEGEIEFPFGGEESFRPRSPPFEWEVRLPNFPRDTFERKSKPVRVEKVFLSTDNKNLIGAVAVANIAFHKRVVARFTLDYWKTTSEVVADFNNDVRRKQTNDGYDRFNFGIKLADQADLENKTMFFCVRYNVNGQEHWDSNDSINFQVDFTKKAKPQDGKQGMQGPGARPLNALPRSRPLPPASPARPLLMPTAFDDFAHGFDSKYDFGAFAQSPTKIMGESPIRFRNTKATNSIVPEAPTKRSNPAAQAFGNRYDFGASLSAAIQAANTSPGDRSGPPAKEGSTAGPKRAFSASRDSSTKGREEAQRDASVDKVEQKTSSASTKKPMVAPGTVKTESGKDSAKPAAITSHKPSVQSSSYHELLDKYCFFGSAKSSPPLTKAKPGQMDGVCDDASVPEYNLELSKSLGSTNPSAPVETPPFIEKTQASSRSDSPHLSCSSSPAVGSRTSSPVSFGYPYRQPMQNGFFPETQAPTAIRG